jgi:murein DD-endopeptidase MepM/ murein hydrolase activator NlpD
VFKRYFTIVFIPHAGHETHTLRVSQGVAAVVMAVLGLTVLGLFSFAGGYFGKVVDQTALATLKAENAVLRTRAGATEKVVATLRGQLNQLAEFEGKIRVLADLTPVDATQRKAGVGGGTRPDELTGFKTDAAKPMQSASLDADQLLREVAFEKNSLAEVAEVLEKRRDVLAHIPSIQPVGGWIFADYGWRRDPVTGGSEFHEGLDIAAQPGTPISAAADGEVTFAGGKSGYGLCVEVDHGYGYLTRYAHCSFIEVSLGDKVRRGQIIALVGATGKATGPHLHYEVHVAGQAVNPIDYILSLRRFD